MARPATRVRSGTLQKLNFNTERSKVHGKSVFSGPGIGFHGFFWVPPRLLSYRRVERTKPLAVCSQSAAASTSRADIILA